jgi:hypothetical protein
MIFAEPQQGWVMRRGAAFGPVGDVIYGDFLGGVRVQ